MINPSEFYSWEIETSQGEIFKQYNEDGTENSSKKIDANQVIRVSIIPRHNLPFNKHDCFIDISKGDRFERRFGRGFVKLSSEGTVMKEYLHCIVTNKYRMYIFSTDGKVLVTNKNHEVYL